MVCMAQNPSCRFANETLSMLHDYFLGDPQCSAGSSVNCACGIARHKWFLPMLVSGRSKLSENDTDEMSQDSFEMLQDNIMPLLNFKSSKAMGSTFVWLHDNEDNERKHSNERSDGSSLGKAYGLSKGGHTDDDDEEGGKGKEEDDDDDEEGNSYANQKPGSPSKAKNSKANDKSSKSKESRGSKEKMSPKDVACELQLSVKDKQQKLDWKEICQ